MATSICGRPSVRTLRRLDVDDSIRVANLEFRLLSHEVDERLRIRRREHGSDRNVRRIGADYQRRAAITIELFHYRG